ncbi:MAG: hypothetical protein ACRYGK_09540 [Janthinobacterium lividum]
MTENLHEYFFSKSYSARGVTLHAPVSANLYDYKCRLKNELFLEHAPNALVLGWRGRKTSVDCALQQFDKAAFLILPGVGDQFSVLRFLQFLKLATESDQQGKVPQVLIVENAKVEAGRPQFKNPAVAEKTRRYYDPLFKEMFGDAPGNEPNGFFETCLQQLFKQTKVRVRFSNHMEETIDLCVKEQRTLRQHDVSFNQVLNQKAYPVDMVHNIFVASTSDKKLEEAAMLFPRQRVTSLQALVGIFPEATEKHLTYEGNAIGTPDGDNSGKAYTIANFLKKILDGEGEPGAKEMFIKELNKRGLNPAQPINIYLDDRGVEFAPEVMAHFDESNTENIEKDRFKPRPGVETTYYVQAKGGDEAFADAINDAFDKAEAAGGVVERQAKHVAVSVLLRFTVATQQVEIISSAGSAVSTFLKKPMMGNEKKLAEYHYLVPLGAGNREGRSAGEIGRQRYVKEFSAQGKSTQVLRDLFRADQVASARSAQQIMDYKVFHAGNGAPVVPKAVTGNSQLDRLIQNHGITSLPRANRKRTQEQASFPGRGQTGTGLNGINALLDGKDAVIFNASHGLPKSELAYLLISIAVAKQLDPLCREILLAIDRSSPELDRLCRLLELGNEVGYIKEQSTTLYSSYESANTQHDELGALTSAHRLDYQRTELDLDVLEKINDGFIDIKAALGTGRPAAFICCSAGSNKTRDDHEVFATVEDLCERGHDIYYGGGDKFMMGQVLNAVNAWNALCHAGTQPDMGPERAVRIVGISTAGIAKRETAHGMPEGIEAYLCETIYGRMLNLIGNSDQLVALNGGAGTVQEILAFAKLKEENSPLTLGKKMTVVNNLVVPGKPRLYEPLLEFYGDGNRETGREVLRQMDIHVEDGIQVRSDRLQAHADGQAA